VNHKKKLDLIRSIESLKGFDERSLSFIAERARERAYDAGQIIFQHGDVGDFLFIVVAGGVCLSFSSEDGREVIVSEIWAGDIAGEIELILDCQRLTTGVACAGTRVLVIGKSAFASLLAQPPFAGMLLKLLCRHMREALIFAENLAVYPLETRLARLLVAMGRTHGKRVGDGIEIERTISQSRMGQMINASRPKINAQLRTWRRRKLILFNNSRITILDQRALQHLSRQQV
jgi:CRP/FNR family cyclic AMP-dependent transcriptional regulator